MPTVVTNPLSGLIDGMLQGYGLGMQIKHQKMQQEAHQRAMAADAREAELKDIQTQMMLGQNARPVNAGTVTESGSALPGLNVGGVDIPTGKVPDLVRPVDKSRRVTYKGRDGQAQEYELMTPDEQFARHLTQAQQMNQADSIPIATPPHLKAMGFGEVMWVPKNQVVHAADALTQTAPVNTPPAAIDLGYPDQVPLRSLPAVMTGVNAAESRRDANVRADNANRIRKEIATDNRVSADKRATNANATRLQAASIRRDQPTANAEGVQNRFQQRQLESDQKTLRDLEAKEAKLHAEKLETGQMTPGKGDDPKAFVGKRDTRLSALDLQIKGIQESKKKLIDKWQSKGGMPQAGGIPANPYR